MQLVVPTLALSLALNGVVLAQSGQQIDLPLTDDTFVNGNAPTVAYGATGEPLDVHTYGPKYTLLQFDAAVIAGARIRSATLTLTPRSVSAAGTVEAYAIVTSWSEMTATYDTMPAAESIVGAHNTIRAGATTFALDVGVLAQRWEDGSLPSAGVLLRTDNSIRALFESRETGAGATLSVIADFDPTPPPPEGNGRRRLGLSSAPVVIDEPGLYYLDRDWIIEHPLTPGVALITIEADDVTLDLGGHSLESINEGSVIDVTGRSFTVRNGEIHATGNGDETAEVISPVHSYGRGTVVEHVAAFGGRA
jgi:hypothetical protein